MPQDPPKNNPRPRSRRPAKGGAPSPAGRLAVRARRVRHELVELYRELAAALDVATDGPDAPPGLDLNLRLPLDDAPPIAADEEPVLAALFEAIDAQRNPTGVLQPGRALCFQCRSTDCEHAAPPDERAVFVEYSATGKPTWRELTEACLVWGEPRVDRLYGDPPGVIAVPRNGRELTAELLEGFGRGDREYRLLGQVVCGYLPLVGTTPGAPDRGALTLQVVGTQRPHEGLRLHLNAIGMARQLSSRRGCPDWWERRALRDAVQESRKELATLALRLDGRRRGGGPIGRDLRAGVDAILGRLRSALERQHRPQQHRTRHALGRRLDGDRPTHTAFADAERVADDRILYEPDRDTVIVLGPKGRVHVFTARDGRHVTSLHHRREGIDGKLEHKQWVPCDPDVRTRFREAVASFRARKPS